ncbi:SRPBCC domain-containing protein [Alkalihalobacillus sp. AL-G]|uniref:SRPBCC domain-containing protein n=1 Tax=Alkalihalobacillus sp. AL-G TaxID=2926399 RepID=UPI00272A5A0F|nr:SRPBCC domain-containing protein [Alkalihalobacillus sp. AL-G]WLD92616.1 SRPBCC domain-containing protein [Alkalihalobacillus sp. AL-G]
MSENKVTNNITTNVEGRVLVLERVFDAPRDLVFKAFSESEHLARWWGPKGWETENRTFDFKPNGVWHYCMECTDRNQGEFYGQKSWGKAVYQEIIEPEKIVYTDVFSDEEGKVAEGMPEMLITMTFVEHEGKTKLTTRTQFASEENLQQVMDMGVVQGISSQYERLDEQLQEMQ